MNKRIFIGIMLTAFVSSLYTCGSRDFENIKRNKPNKISVKETKESFFDMFFQQAEVIREGIPSSKSQEYFQMEGKDNNITIFLDECKCEYDCDSLQVYTKDIRNMGAPSGYVVYIRTPFDDWAVFSDANFIIDIQKGDVYIQGNSPDDGFFESIYGYFAGEDGKISGCKILSKSIVDQWLADAHQLPVSSLQQNFTDLRVTSISLEYEHGNAILKGEASGIYIPTGKKYYVDWEMDRSSGEEKVTPCILKIYDLEMDKDIFEDCSRVFDQIERGDWSLIEPFDYLEWLTGKENILWRRADINGDGMPELISLYAEYSEINGILPIEYILAYHDGKAECVFWDLVDMSEYFFLGNNGNMVYNFSNYGQIDYESYSQYQLDEKWNRKLLGKLEVYYFYDDDTYDTEEISYYKENYPDTYGTGGSGIYCFESHPKTEEELKNNEGYNYWTREPITKEEFLKAYHEMTGFDFLEENSDWQHIWDIT